MTRFPKILGLAVPVACAVGAFVAVRAGAAGIPAAGALTYAGTLQDTSGKPLSGPQYIAIQLWDSATSTASSHRVCDTGDAALTPLVNGRFSITLPDACTQAVGANPDLFVDVLVGATAAEAEALGTRSKLGAVPFAVEAGNAAQLGNKPAAAYQQRISGSCESGQTPLAVNEDGSLECGATITTWKPFTPAIVLSSAGHPTLDAKSGGSWRRVGDSIEVAISTQFTAAAADDASLVMWQLPNQLKPANGTAGAVGGSAEAWNGTSVTACIPEGVAGEGVIILDCHGAATLSRSQVGPSGSGKIYSVGIRYSIPIAGWTLTSP